MYFNGVIANTSGNCYLLVEFIYKLVDKPIKTILDSVMFNIYVSNAEVTFPDKGIARIVSSDVGYVFQVNAKQHTYATRINNLYRRLLNKVITYVYEVTLTVIFFNRYRIYEISRFDVEMIQIIQANIFRYHLGGNTSFSNNLSV